RLRQSLRAGAGAAPGYGRHRLGGGRAEVSRPHLRVPRAPLHPRPARGSGDPPDLYAGGFSRRTQRAPGLGVFPGTDPHPERLVPPAQPRRRYSQPLHRRRRDPSRRGRAGRGGLGQGHRRADAGGPDAMSDQVIAQATQSINVGSKSFAAAARLFDERTRQSAVMLYAWCRHCDDVIDGQVLGQGQLEGDRSSGEERLAMLVELTERAYAGELMPAPAFAAFQQVVQRHGIPPKYPLEHLAGFRMDVQGYRYQTLDDTLLYCYRVAGVVGLMMAQVMGAESEATLDRACDLGLAFQLTNIARDIVEDAQIGRVYLPADWLEEV